MSYCGLFLISMAVLALEVLHMRLFAFALWHHLAFLVMSIAIIGLSAAGAGLACVDEQRRRSLELPARGSLLFAGACLLGPLYLAAYPVDVFGQVYFPDFVRVGGYYALFATPYMFAGVAIAQALGEAPDDAPGLYAANMLGSGAGCMLVFPLLQPLGAEGVLLLTAAQGGGAALCFSRRPAWRVASGLATAVFVVGGLAGFDYDIRIAGSKLLRVAQVQVGADCEAPIWTPVCRVDVCTDPASGNRYLFQDGDAVTQIVGPTTKPEPSDLRQLAYAVAGSVEDALIVGVGGGLDVVTALERGATGITGVELNRATLDIAGRALAAHRARHPDARVWLHRGEGRSFVRSSEARFDLIQMTGVDTYTALASGAYVLSENYLYTREAFVDYLDHLRDDGLVALVRFAFPVPREALRVVVLAAAALRETGAAEPWRHIAVVRANLDPVSASRFDSPTGYAAILVKKAPFAEDELDRLVSWSDGHRARIDYEPRGGGRWTEADRALLARLRAEIPAFAEYPLEGGNPFWRLADSLRSGTEREFLDAYPFDVSVVTDDSPFFFNQHRPEALLRWLWSSPTQAATSGWVGDSVVFQTRPVGMLFLLVTSLQLLVLVGVCVFAPLAFTRGLGGGNVAEGAFFLAIGLGYMLVMVSAMQRFGLLLGHPSYAVSVTMAGFLSASAAGSYATRWVSLSVATRFIGACACALLGVALLAQSSFDALSGAVLSWPFGLRVVTVLALITPLAVLMGFCFPTGIRLLALNESARRVPWVYGVNAAGTVLGSVTAIYVAMAGGFSSVLWLGAVCYLVAAVAIRVVARRYEGASV